jgi:tetratricopeptide (TPR) repeat protein
MGDLAVLKEEIKGLVTRWKSLDGDVGPPAPSPEPPRATAEPLPTRTDHLNASSFIEKGWSLISLGEPAAAEQVLRKALALVPNDTQAAALLGWALMLQECFDEALAHFQQVLQREPSNALARVNVGYICLRKGIFGEAIEHLSRTIRLDNDRKATLYAHLYLGLLYFEREMHDDAESFLRKAIALGPNLVEAHYQLGRVRWFAGNQEGARRAWRDGVSANKFSPWGKRCAEVLEQVEAGGSPSR